MEYENIKIDMRLVDLGKLRAFADVTLSTEVGEITLKGFRVVSGEEGRYWVGLPQNTFSKNGKRVNRPVMEMAPRVKRHITDKVLSVFEEKININSN